MDNLPEKLTVGRSHKGVAVEVLDEKGLVVCVVSHTGALDLAETLVIGYNDRFGLKEDS